MTTTGADRPITLLVSAIGGEGGGVLSGWIVEAAKHAGYPVQSTSIPGVAQRTGATTYYLEIFPVLIDALGGKRPVLAIYPGVGDVDIMVASEFVESGRAISNGFITPDRTVLIASTHRVYSTGERMAMGDGRFDTDTLHKAIARRSKNALLADLRAVAQKEGVSLNAILLGVLAGSGLLPLPAGSYEEAIRAGGIAVEPNLKGFAVGMAYQFTPEAALAPTEIETKRHAVTASEALEARIAAGFPECAHEVLLEGARRLTDYQDESYGVTYLERVTAIWAVEQAAGGDGTLTREVGRQLALRMSYEDVIRVAQLKSAPERYERVRAEVRAKPHEPIVVLDYFKPGIDELCAVLPSGLARPLLALSARRGWQGRAHLGMKIRSTSIFGYGCLRLLAGLRNWRPKSHGFKETQDQIDDWLTDVKAAVQKSLELALEVSECVRLIKGYGDTFRRGQDNFDRIRDALIVPALDGNLDPARATDALANARAAALADPEGTRLSDVLASFQKTELNQAAE
ncbi:MAG: indolepyruvate oxidoreductase subunit beta family protein [Rhodospirillaceae bacterium]|nr:indolepyruvate oxidoreductase subunit beta family protein [Rhodospirillaceae bacterium]MBT5458947.1 indolepyruvate oxidoreductase subunit beta family protein [Rhodospirillaceae bacterium]